MGALDDLRGWLDASAAIDASTVPVATSAPTPAERRAKLANAAGGLVASQVPLADLRPWVREPATSAVAKLRSWLNGSDYAGERANLSEALTAQQSSMFDPKWGMVLAHGTPSTWAPEPGAPLGQFRRSFAHSGEGGAYKGAGAYVAEAPAVAEKYRTRLSRPEVRPLSRAAEPMSDAQQEALESLQRTLADLKGEYGLLPSKEKALAEWRQSLESRAAVARRDAEHARAWAERRPEYAERIAQYGETTAEEAAQFEVAAKNMDDVAKWARSLSDNDLDIAGGALYKLDFPDEHLPRVLDFDAPLSDQTPDVRRAIESAGLPTRAKAAVRETVPGKRWETVVENMDGTKEFHGPFESSLEAEAEAFKVNSPWDRSLEPTGEDLYHALVTRNGGRNSPEAAVKASRTLAEAGIPAHRFLDAVSRDVGEGTRNFVVYEPDKHLKTLARYRDLSEWLADTKGGK